MFQRHQNHLRSHPIRQQHKKTSWFKCPMFLVGVALVSSTIAKAHEPKDNVSCPQHLAPPAASSPSTVASYAHLNFCHCSQGPAIETENGNSENNINIFYFLFWMTTLGLLPLLFGSSFTISKIPLCRLRFQGFGKLSGDRTNHNWCVRLRASWHYLQILSLERCTLCKQNETVMMCLLCFCDFRDFHRWNCRILHPISLW